MDFDSMIEKVTISSKVIQVKEDYMYLYRSLESEGLSQDTGDGFNMAFVLLDRAYHMQSIPSMEEIAEAVKEDPELGVG
tara:strand:+ start:1922 stop:2158 length:237 start_codon:yes stop_codon:yes gene_type:complete